MQTATLIDSDGIEIFYRSWLPAAPTAIVLVLHGASEHSGRYDAFARALNGAGYAVYADDHRGFGHSASQTGIGKSGPRGFDGVLDSIYAVQDLVQRLPKSELFTEKASAADDHSPQTGRRITSSRAGPLA